MKGFLYVILLGLGLGTGIGNAVSAPGCDDCDELMWECRVTQDTYICRLAFNCYRWCDTPIP